MTNLEQLHLFLACAKEYRTECNKRVKRKLKQETVDAIFADFITFVAEKNGIDNYKILPTDLIERNVEPSAELAPPPIEKPAELEYVKVDAAETKTL
jgi:hypothetical protein